MLIFARKIDIAANADMMLLDLAASYLYGRRQGMQLCLYRLVVHISCACSFSVYRYGCNDLQLQCPRRGECCCGCIEGHLSAVGDK